ncbi:App1 family protein [Galbibacter pacificus]|uniref:App1 family protein n=1 Tax=Galbibacter pacificus TaxID=2996052 RepID=A0ABT6FUW5_9FLAO|nr:App1 family protein [Galbibacter pacificus]MDG3583467.1 App1 family protein [Galbibacter pacificus]MDG3587056.1 App1 family protein [Galbibacter pacificus]
MKFDLSLYRGYANEEQVILFGHVFKSLAPEYLLTDKKGYRHAKGVFEMFTIKTLKNASVKVYFNNREISTQTTHEGYFRVCIPCNGIDAGWHAYRVEAYYKGHMVEAESEFLKPFPGKIGVISDIDDTFLISHTNNIFKKLYVLLTKNVQKRKIFDDVATHYSLLSKAGRTDKMETNTFFYVSSSEWNLYSFILNFTKLHQLPKAVFKLKKIKSGLTDFLFSGRGNHRHKFNKIKDILEFYPQMNFVLMGDDSQKDPGIYEEIVKYFPKNVAAVYIRQTTKKQNSKTVKMLQNIETFKVPTCYFVDSSIAIAHSKTIGLL